jgi:flagellar biosynthesis GTPase FlhF
MSNEEPVQDGTKSPLMAFVLENRSWMSGASVLMIIYAVWAVLEVFSNTFFHGLQGLTFIETGTATNVDPDDLQRNNSGLVIASGAVLGMLGLYAQYVYRAAPYVDASMAATAAMILDQANTDRMGEENILAKAEEAAVAAAAEVAKETAEDTVIEMLDPEANIEETEAEEEEAEEEEAEEEEAEEEPEEEAEAEEEPEDESVDETVEEEEETPPEDKKKF